MTARISRNFSLMAGVYFKNDFCMNLYDIDLDFSVETDSIREQNISVERIKYYLGECLENAVFINQAETEVIQKYMDADLKVCTLPEDPYDQIIGILLITKLNAITEGKLVINNIAISSRISDEVVCYHSIDENMGPFNMYDWWSDNSTKINSTKATKNKKVVKLVKSSTSWEDIYLGWDQTDEIPPQMTSPSEIVFANFDNKTDKE